MGCFLHPPGVSAIVGGQAVAATGLQAIAQVEHCSGVLVRSDAVLTSAHCLDGRIDRIVLAEKPLSVTRCSRHPAYEPGRAKHDIGFCRLAAPAPAPAIPLDDGPELAPGDVVSMAGFGLPSAFARDRVAPRIVETSVQRVAPDGADVGTAEATACRGDSGGPVLVRRSGEFRVAAIIHGAAGAICRGPAEVVLLTSNRAWLETELGAGNTRVDSASKSAPLIGAAICALLCTSTILLVLRAKWHGKRLP